MAPTIPITQAAQPNIGGAAVVDFVDSVADMVIPANDGLLTIEIYNPTGGPLTFDFQPTTDQSGRAFAPEPVVVAAGTTVVVGPLPPTVYNQTNGTVLCGSSTPGLKVRGTRI